MTSRLGEKSGPVRGEVQTRRDLLTKSYGFLRDRRGGSAIIFGLTLPILIGFLGLSIETSLWYFEKRKLQEVADTAALAGALEKANDPAALYKDAAVRAAEQSGHPNLDPNKLWSPPNTGLFTADQQAVEAVVVKPYPTHFVSLFGLASVDITTRAVATSNGNAPPQDACITACAATDPEVCGINDPGFLIQGNTNLTTVQCSIHSNDSCSCSYDFNGQASDVSVSCMTYSGGVDEDPTCGAANDNIVVTGDAPICDDLYGPVGPFIGPDSPCGRLEPNDARTLCQGAAAAPPPVETPNLDGNGNVIGTRKEFWPGLYEDNSGSPNIGGLVPAGTPGDLNVLNAGLYCIGGGSVTADFRINGGSLDARGGDNNGDGVQDGVTMVMMDEGSEFDFAGNGNLYWVAPAAGNVIDPFFDPIPTSGAEAQWEGVGIYLADSTGLGDAAPCGNKITGTGDLEFGGEILGPGTCLTFTGNNASSGNADEPCFRITVGNIALSGDVTLDSSGCSDYGSDTPGLGIMTAIVE